MFDMNENKVTNTHITTWTCSAAVRCLLIDRFINALNHLPTCGASPASVPVNCRPSPVRSRPERRLAPPAAALRGLH